MGALVVNPQEMLLMSHMAPVFSSSLSATPVSPGHPNAKRPVPAGALAGNARGSAMDRRAPAAPWARTEREQGSGCGGQSQRCEDQRCSLNAEDVEDVDSHGSQQLDRESPW